MLFCLILITAYFRPHTLFAWPHTCYQATFPAVATTINNFEWNCCDVIPMSTVLCNQSLEVFFMSHLRHLGMLVTQFSGARHLFLINCRHLTFRHEQFSRSASDTPSWLTASMFLLSTSSVLLYQTLRHIHCFLFSARIPLAVLSSALLPCLCLAASDSVKGQLVWWSLPARMFELRQPVSPRGKVGQARCRERQCLHTNEGTGHSHTSGCCHVSEWLERMCSVLFHTSMLSLNCIFSVLPLLLKH